MLKETFIRTTACLSGLTININQIKEKMNNTFITQDSYDKLYKRIDDLSGLLTNNSSSNTPDLEEPINPDITQPPEPIEPEEPTEPETPPTQEVTYVYECISCGDSSVIGKYREITKEEYDKIYSSSGFTFGESDAANIYTYYMNENNSVLVESKIQHPTQYETTRSHKVVDAQMGTVLYRFGYGSGEEYHGFRLEDMLDFLWEIHQGVEFGPVFIKL